MTSRNIEEAIYQLQKSNTEDGVKQLVEEAAQLFAKGRHMEAGALMEKAEALVANSGAQPANRPSSAPASKPEIKLEERVDDQAMANVAGRLADGLSKILTGAFQELERHIIGESIKASTSLAQQLEKLRATVESLTLLRGQLEQLTQAVTDHKTTGTALGQKHDEVSTQVAALLETTARHQTELGALRGETGTLRTETAALRTEAKDFSAKIAHQVDGVTSRLGLQHEELAGLKSHISDVSGKVTGFVERLDRQAEVLRSLNDTQARRAAALDELLAVLTRLKAPAESMVAMAAAGQ